MTLPRRPQTHYTPGSTASVAPLATDVLPKAARLDKRYNLNAPSFASAQSLELAQHYGVMRNGAHVSLDGAPWKSPEPAPAPVAPAPAAPPAPATPSVVKPSIVEAPIMPPKAGEEEEAEEPEERDPREDLPYQYDPDPPMMAPTDLAQLREAVIQTALNSPEQRRIVESRLKGEPTIEQMVLDEPIYQTVVIVPDRMEITYRLAPYESESTIKKMIAEEAKGPVFDEYLLDKYALLGMAASLHKINAEEMPNCYDAEGMKVVPELLAKKAQWLMRRPTPLIVMLSIQYVWFYDRMLRLTAAMAGAVKNG